ncbi:MAG: hypothetical protein ACP5P6_11455 [Candidatus Saccharicenans sp.]
MKKKIIIALAILVLGTIIINYLVYRPILICLDKRLSERAELLKEGMSEQEVIKIMGKPKECEELSVNEVEKRGIPKEVVGKLQYGSSQILCYEYYVPIILQAPHDLRPRPTRTVIYIYFDGNKKVRYVLNALAVFGIGHNHQDKRPYVFR